MGFRAIIARVSSTSTDLARHASIQDLKCMCLSLVLVIILNFLKEEINLHSEHIRLLEGVHALLTWLELVIAPPLVVYHLLN